VFSPDSGSSVGSEISCSTVGAFRIGLFKVDRRRNCCFAVDGLLIENSSSCCRVSMLNKFLTSVLGE
jgi:hypothetical protein